MKKLRLFTVTLLFPAFVLAQGGVEIVPFAGYMFGGSVQYVQGKLNINNGLNYGISVLVPVKSMIDVELNFTRMDQVKVTFDPYTGYPGLENEELDLITNYFQVGAVSKFYNNRGSIVEPFGSLSLGATWFDPTKNENSSYTNYEDVWRFSVTVGLGLKLMFSERVGIMLRGRLMMPMTWGGTGFYFGTGGSGLTFNTWVAPLQGDFNGGLIIRIGGS